MKLNCGLSKEDKWLERFKDVTKWLMSLQDWHDWFAWYPIRVGNRDCRWLETVERRDARRVYDRRAVHYMTGSKFAKPKFMYRAKENN